MVYQEETKAWRRAAFSKLGPGESHLENILLGPFNVFL